MNTQPGRPERVARAVTDANRRRANIAKRVLRDLGRVLAIACLLYVVSRSDGLVRYFPIGADILFMPALVIACVVHLWWEVMR